MGFCRDLSTRRHARPRGWCSYSHAANVSVQGAKLFRKSCNGRLIVEGL